MAHLMMDLSKPAPLFDQFDVCQTQVEALLVTSTVTGPEPPFSTQDRHAK